MEFAFPSDREMRLNAKVRADHSCECSNAKTGAFVQPVDSDVQLSPTLQLISEALFAAVVGATVVAALSGAQLPGKNFIERFVYYLWRYTLPACVFSIAIFWVVWGGLR
ncbi:MAG: hypothetical protein WCE87_02395 [Candidatus Udaeobacter sp.]